MAEHRPRVGDVLGERAVADRKAQLRTLGARALRSARHEIAEVRLRELAGGDAHGDLDAAALGRELAPTARLTASLGDRPRTDLDDEPGLLERREELARRHGTALRILPVQMGPHTGKL